MLEQARFSLARAGVMVGLCGLLAWVGGALLNPRQLNQKTPSVHFSAQTWQRLQTALHHVKPGPIGSTTNHMVSAHCPASNFAHHRLLLAARAFQNHLDELHQMGFLKQTYTFDGDSWVQDPALQQASCAELAKILRWFNEQARRQGDDFWANLNWIERLPASAQGRFEPFVHVNLPRHMLTKRSAWAGLPGCVYASDAQTGQRLVVTATDGPTSKFCRSQKGAESSPRVALSWPSTVPGWALLLDPLSPWRLPQHPLHQQVVGDQHEVQWAGQIQNVGLHVQLSIDPRWQVRLQALLACFSGHNDPACSRYAIAAHDRYENARVRMAGVAVIDIPSGRIVAAASADSPCHAHDKARLGKAPSDCPVLPEGTVHRPETPQTLSNHAVFTHAAPGSLVKPLLMAGILQDASPQASLKGLEQALQRSDSAQFLDALLCRQHLGRGSFSAVCERPAKVQRSAHQLGWNSGCEQVGTAGQCGMIDLLHGEPTISPAAGGSVSSRAQTPKLAVLMGQTLVQPLQSPEGWSGYVDLSWPQNLPNITQRIACAQSGVKGYVRCRGPNLGLVSEAYGQGNTLSTPLGVAGLFAALGSSAQGQPPRYPHLVVDLLRSNGETDPQARDRWLSAQAKGPQGIPPSVAHQVLHAMETTHLPGGTAHAACVRVMGSKACQRLQPWAGKTGTPGDADERSLDQLAKSMRDRAECLSRSDVQCAIQHPLPRPRYRWYAAVFKSAGSVKYDKALAVLVHSNWRRSDGRYADDQNAAAEIGFWAMLQFQEIPRLP